MDEARKAELKSCFFWTCDDCGRDNFTMPIKAEFGDGEREAAFRNFHEMEPYEPLPEGWEGFEMVCAPERVTCQFCGAEFDAFDERESE